MLDEQHGQLPAKGNDDNTYTLGKVGAHNVVIARPAEYGTNSAAYTAANMELEEVRPGLQSSKIHKKKIFDLETLWSGFLNIRIHDFEEGEMVNYLQEALERMPKTKKLKMYHFPGWDKDQLFKADYSHKENTRDCSACDPDKREGRIDRETNDPVVHYGLIASGNTVMRSAQRRDELRDKEKVVCFEMEAAGLMNNFPCLVVRGICDYSDDHKNDRWQPYAALTAAAYAKDLLRVVQPKDVENTKAIADVIEGCQLMFIWMFI
ncbi:hypothetical protein ABW20_dc0106287 [Dactylellina cionopaga]|nr:hypothetical protein ABW20_dc0106287 [Dactylellina cionopaga]